MKDTEQDTLRKLQLTQLEILKLIDKLCRKYDIAYSLYAGTLLGAVRHNGFIPWDDDLDICMRREDYQRFLKVWDEDHPDGYILQNKENATSFSQSFTKIRKDHTCFLQFKEEIGKYHTGIFVDVFPIDRMPACGIKKKVFQFRCLKYQLLTREFVPPKSGLLQKILASIILFFSPAKHRASKRSKLLKKIMRYNDREDYPAVAIETLSSIRSPLPASFMTKFTELYFEDSRFMCSAVWDEYLSVKYGDYMKLPPESEREWKHHPIILDFFRNYNELTDQEKVR